MCVPNIPAHFSSNHFILVPCHDLFGLFSVFKVAAVRHCEGRTSRSLLSAGTFFTWLDILFPEFPRDQIRAAREITSRIQLTLKYLSLIWENRGGGGHDIPLSCMSSRDPLFNCIIVNEVLMQLQETGLSLSSHESHVTRSPDRGHAITEHSFCSSPLKHTYRLWRLAFWAQHVTPHHPPSCHIVRKEQRGLLNVCVCVWDVVIICLFQCAGGAAEALGGFLSSHSLPGLERV